jgi:hypothetical protein
MAESVHTEPPGHEPPAGYERVVVPELGFAAEVPDAWQRSDYAYGLETGFRSIGSEGSLVIRRAETMMPDAEVERWVSRTLDAWVADVLGVEQLGEVDDSEEPWAFGADHRVERDYPDIGAWATMGFSPYIAGHPECGGTAFMAMTEGADPETTSFIRDSLVVQQSLPGIQALDETTAMSGFSIDLSDDWALLAPATSGDAGMVLRAHDCATGARVEIGVRESGGRSLDASVDAVVERHASELAGFELDDRRAVQLPSGEAAIEIDSSFVADALDVSQRELIALDGGDLYLVTVTTPAGGVGDDVVDEVIGTFALTGT